jgi:hypothetical protein
MQEILASMTEDPYSNPTMARNAYQRKGDRHRLNPAIAAILAPIFVPPETPISADCICMFSPQSKIKEGC